MRKALFMLGLVYAYFLETLRGFSSCPALNASSYDLWLNEKRKEEVKEEFRFVWSNYVNRAMGFDSIRPVDGLGQNDWGGVNLFMIESLDTMYLMGFHDWFNEAADFVTANTDFGRNFTSSVFETTIRLLGGLLSAAELSHRESLIEKATDLGYRLVKTFRVNDTFPYPWVNMGLGVYYYSQFLVLSEVTTLSLEFRKLAQLTHISHFSRTVAKVETFFLRKLRAKNGILRQHLAISNHDFYGKYTIGGGTDSFYEYLYKSWIFQHRSDSELRSTYEFSKWATIEKLMHTSETGFTYMRAVEANDEPSSHMEHLACFFPGLLGLENILETYDPYEVQLAQKLMEACLEPVRTAKTNLVPEGSSFFQGEVKPQAEMQSNQLRPEVIESLFYMWRLTHDEYYRDMGYRIFEAFKQHCKSHFGYSAVEDVNEVPTRHTNDQPSYFTAEVLKYLYLLFSPVLTT